MRPNIDTLRPMLSVKLSGIVWKIKISSTLLAVESRHAENKVVAFSVFDLSTGAVNFLEKSYPEQWNLSLDFVHDDAIILHSFETGDIPKSKGIVALDPLTGNIKWEKYNITIDHVQNEGIRIYDSRLQPRRYQWLVLNDGNLTDEQEISNISGADIVFPDFTTSMALPHFIDKATIVGQISYLARSGKSFISFHQKTGDTIAQRVIVYQQDSVLLDDIIISGIQKLQPETFFIQQNQLFYIRNKREIISYLI